MNRPPLLAAAAVGLLLAAFGALDRSAVDETKTADPSREVAATVRDVPIHTDAIDVLRERLSRPSPAPDAALRAPVTGRDAPPPAPTDEEILERLIDDELLIQRAVDLGLLQSDPQVRKAIVHSMIDALTSRAKQNAPSDADVLAFYEANEARFRSPTRVHLRKFVIVGSDRQSDERVRRAEEELAQGIDFEKVRARYADDVATDLPDVPLSAHVLRRQLGPTLTDAALALEAGETRGPLASPGGRTFLHLVARDRGALPPLDEIREQVAAELRHERADLALRGFLDDERGRATITLAEDITPRPSR